MSMVLTTQGQPRNTTATEIEHRVRLLDGRMLACLEIGDPAGRPVLYFHGYPGSRIESRVAASDAARLGVRLLAIDRPGFGESTFQPGRTVRDWAADVAALADRLSLTRFSILGVSGGGPYALACAAAFPERLTGLALLCPLGPLDTAGGTAGMLAQDRLMLALAARAAPVARAVVHLLARWMRTDAERYINFMMRGLLPPDRDLLLEPGYRALLKESTGQALRQGGRGVAWELPLLARPWNFPLEEVGMPVSIWQGLADQIIPAAMTRRLAASLPVCKTRFIPGEGHLSLIVRHIGSALREPPTQPGSPEPAP